MNKKYRVNKHITTAMLLGFLTAEQGHLMLPPKHKDPVPEHTRERELRLRGPRHPFVVRLAV